MNAAPDVDSPMSSSGCPGTPDARVTASSTAPVVPVSPARGRA